MKPHTPSILDTFGEALDVFVMVLKQTWLKVLPVFLLAEGVHALYRRHAMKGGVMPLDSFRTDNNVSTLLGVTVGLFAVVTVVRAAYMHCCEAYGDEEPQGGRVEAWGRLLGTTWLIGIIVVGIVIAGLIVMLGFGLGMRSPLAAVGTSPIYALAPCLIFLPLFAAIGVIVCLSVRWSFAPILSVVTSCAGTSALSESNAWVKGRFGRVFLFLSGAYLICAGMGFPFNFPCVCALTGPLLGFTQLASPSAWWWTCALSLAGDFAMLYLPVALLVFWLLLQSGPEAEVEPGRHRGIVLVLLTLGFAGWIFSLACGVKAGMHARDESRAASQAKIDELTKTIAELHGRLETSAISESDKALVKGFAAKHAKIDGAELVSEFAPDGCWKNGVLFELQHELKERPFVLARARVNSVDVGVMPTKVVVTPDAPNRDPRNDASFAFRCSISQSALAADFVPGDILTNLTARIGETDRAPWPSVNGMRPLRLTHASFGFAGEVSPLPEFDAKTITGDELLALIADIPGGLRRSHVKELASRLAGRRLVFHDLCVRGSSTSYGRNPSDGVVSRGIDFAKANSWRSLFCARFEGEAQLKLAEELSAFRGSSGAVRELTAIVSDDVSGVRSGTRPGLCVSCVECKLTEPIPELPEFDPDEMTGDKVVELMKSLKTGYSPILVKRLVERLSGRTLTFTDLKVLRMTDDRRGLVDITARHVYGKDDWRDSVSVRACVKKSDLDALPWGFALGSPIVRLTGKVETGYEGLGYRAADEIPLTNVTFEVAWANEKAPEVDADSITGDELVRLVAGFDVATREAKRERIFKRLAGRRLTFSSAVVETVPTHVDGWRLHQGCLAFGADDQTRAACKWPVEFESGAAFNDLSKGLKLTNVSVTVSSTLAPRADMFPESFVARRPGAALAPLGFKDVSYELSERPEPLPEFDAQTITGDELFALLAKRKTALSVSQLDELQTALAGRRLTFAFGRARFHGMTGLDDGHLLSVHFPLADDRLSNAFVGEFALGGRMSANSTGDFFMEISTIGKSITGTVAKPGSGIKSSGKLFFVQAEVEIDKDREVKIMRRK